MNSGIIAYHLGLQPGLPFLPDPPMTKGHLCVSYLIVWCLCFRVVRRVWRFYRRFCKTAVYHEICSNELQNPHPNTLFMIISRHQKEGLVQMLVTEKIRSLSDRQPGADTDTPPATPPSPPRPSPSPSPSSGGQAEHKRTSYDGGGPEWTPPPETWTEAEFGGGGRRDRVARVTGEGTVVPMIRIRPR